VTNTPRQTAAPIRQALSAIHEPGSLIAPKGSILIGSVSYRQNRLLAALRPSELALLHPHLKHMALVQSELLQD
jgi:hypothetical protein